MIRYLFWGALAGAAIAAPAIAKADPADVPYAICGALASDPSIDNLFRVLEQVKAGGLTQQETSDVVVDSVMRVCPRYYPLLQQFVDDYGPGSTASPMRRDVLA